MHPVTPLAEIGIILFVILLGLYLLSGFLFLRQSTKHGGSIQVKILSLIGTFFILAGIARLFHPVLYLALQVEIFFYIGQVVSVGAIILIVLYVEKIVVHKSHFAFSIALLCLECIFIIGPLAFPTVFIGEISSFMLAVALSAAGVLIFVTYLIVAIRTAGEVRLKSIYLLVGGTCLAVSYLINGLENSLGFDSVMIIAAILSFVAIPFLLKAFGLSLK